MAQEKLSSKINSYLARFSPYFIISGIICLIISAFLLWQRTTPQRLAFAVNKIENQQSVNYAISPTLLQMPDLDIQLPVIPAYIQDGKWQATSKGVSYLAASAFPGETGNSILYGHNWPNLLGRLTKAVPGQEFSIIFSNGQARRFVIDYTQIVTPDQTHILQPTSDKRLTLYTCTGFLDRYRFVVTAVPQT